ncbi:MAG: ComF family protein [Treponema sp.]|nr:ComF family protein [Treponema sp.]
MSKVSVLFCCFNSFLSFVFSFLFMRENCTVCSGETFYYPVCSSCLKKYFFKKSFFKENRCSWCGKFLSSEEKLCSECRTMNTEFCFSRSLPLFPYRLWYKSILFSWKMKENRSFSRLFARCIYNALREAYGKEIPPVVPVPPRPGKIREKGWDQMEDIVSILEKLYKIKVLRLLKRVSRKQQKKLGREGRLSSAEKGYVFAGNEVFFRNSLPEEVVVIDDVFTTGSTMENCARVLKAAGIGKVTAMTLFIVD